MESPTVMIPAYEALARQLVADGVTHMFGLLGDGNMRFAVAADALGVEYVAARHENAAIAMADGYARVTGRPGIATVTTGPGVTNSFTGLGEAVRARTPMVVIAGATARGAWDYPQLIDQDGMTKALGCGVQRYRGPEYLAADTAEALRRARVERRPIMLAVPGDEQETLVEVQRLITWEAPRPAVPSEPALAEVVAALSLARRPVILAGWGAREPETLVALRDLADMTGAILMTTANLKGAFSDYRFAGGVSGGFCAESVAALLTESDLLLAFGASLNKWTMRDGALYPRARVVQVDDDSSAFGRYVNVTPILGDSGEAARALLELMRADDAQVGFHTETVAGILAGAVHGDSFDDSPADARLDPRSLILAVDRMLPDSSVVVTDSGSFMGFPMGYLRGRGVGSHLFAQAFQSVGLGLATTSGVGHGYPSRLPVTVIGDGGLMMSLGDLETIVRIGRPHLVIVFNDSAYGAEIHVAAHHDLPADLVIFPEVDFAAIARSVGGDGVVVTDLAHLERMRVWLEAPTGLFVVDAKVTPTVMAPFMAEAFRTHDTEDPSPHN